MNEPEQMDLWEYSEEHKETFGIHPNQKKLIAGVQRPGGCQCWACGGHAQLYHRTITYSMCKCLIFMYRYYQKHPYTESMHFEGYIKRVRTPSATRGDFTKLQYWGLIVKPEGNRPDGSNRTGHYKITSLGQQFVKGLLKVPKVMMEYKGNTWGSYGENVDIFQCMKNKFNYDELMRKEIEHVG